MTAVRPLELAHRGGSTRIYLGTGALDAAQSEIATWVEGRRLFVVSSEPVRRLHGDRLESLLKTTGAVAPTFLEIPDGEAGKSLAVVEQLTREMARAGGKRDSRLLTFGGGTVGDLGGFVAACFLRGIDYSHLPTTLLAQVDAAIGGKTGVNLPEAKNSVGAFHQPRFVIADAGVLRTLPSEEIRQGLFEVIKAAILADEELFRLLEERLPELLAAEPDALEAAVEAAVAVKVSVVESDERESDRRRLLNLGHTLGHALETVVGHGKLGHGDAVGHGMLFAIRLAERRGLSGPDAERMRALIGRMAPTALPKLDPADLERAMTRDKKARETGLPWVLPTRIGAARVVDDVSRAEVLDSLAVFLTGSIQSP